MAMSGGVDSSVAAALLREQGYECVGVFMRVGAEQVPADTVCTPATTTCAAAAPVPCSSAASSDEPAATARRTALPQMPVRRAAHRHGCCSADDALDARAIAAKLGIPFYALNFRDEFNRIIDYFVAEYSDGRTPNPCVMCNIHLKFGRLLQYADMIDAEFVATGHYARILRDADGAPRLARARNRAKDQSYVLFGTPREALSRCLFPLGEFSDKAEIRGIASRLGMRVHDKPDSQEICFVPDNDYRGLLRRRAPSAARAGEIRDADGRVLGSHDGVWNFTIGQRRGLGFATGEPRYVTDLDPVTGVVTVGPQEALRRRTMRVTGVNWHTILPDPLSADALAALAVPPATESPAARSAPTAQTLSAVALDAGSPTTLRCLAKIRHQHEPCPASMTRTGADTVLATFDEPQPAVTPGQAAVFYDGELVIGGGWIARE